MKAKNAKSAAVIALMSLLHGTSAFAEGHTFTPLENLPPEQRQEITEKLNKVASEVDNIDWDELVVGVNEHGKITFRNKSEAEMQVMGSFSCASSGRQ